MGIADELAEWPSARIIGLVDRATDADVDTALAAERRTERDLGALLSAAASRRIEELARVAHHTTRMNFGRTIGMYAPIYISNLCAADCVYCSYAAHSGAKEKRRTLTEDEIAAECRALASAGMKNILLLTGEAPRSVGVEYVARAVEIAAAVVPSVSVEIFALDGGGYARLVGRGLEGVTIYQETYDRTTYGLVHQGGQKVDFDFRLGAPSRAGAAGARRLSVGALLGLCDWRLDGFRTAIHARHLEKECWRSAVSVSFPRLKGVPPRFSVPHPVSDREFVQLILALRLFLPHAGMNLSTREPAVLRDNVIPLGITMMSAGSSTRPGGYTTTGRETLAQFDVADERPIAEVVAAIRRAGYEPVWKDYDAAFVGRTAAAPAGAV